MGWQILMIVLALAAGLAAVIAIYIAVQGNEKVVLLGKERTLLACREAAGTHAVFSLKVPLVNNGRQDGIVLDAFARLLLPLEQFDLARVLARLERENVPRADDYMEAFVVHPGERHELILTIAMDAVAGDIKYVLENMVDVTVDVYYQVVGRTAPHIEKCIIDLSLEEFQQCLGIQPTGGSSA